MECHFFECHCHSPEHTLVFHLFDDDPKMLCAHVFLNPDNFFKRIWNSIKYIFGYKCAYGHFDEFIFNPKDAQKLMNLLEQIKEST
jgi:hypothetical protein